MSILMPDPTPRHLAQCLADSFLRILLSGALTDNFFADTEEARSPSESRSFLCYGTGVMVARSFLGLWLGGNL